MIQKEQNILYAEGFFPSEKRWLFYRYWQSPLSKGDVIAIHGAAEHSGRYKELGEAFIRTGYNFYVFDLTGHGRSEGKRGYIQQFEDYITDLGNFYAFLRKYKNMKNPFLLGHSMGALSAIYFAAMQKCYMKGMILSGPLLKLNISVPIWKKLAVSFMNMVYPSFSLSNGIEAAALTHDYEIIEDYKSDPFVSTKITARWFCELARSMKGAQKVAQYIDIPCLIVHGEEDAICDRETSKNFFNDLGSEKKDFFSIKSCYHEVFNESFREQIIEKVFQWIKQVDKDTVVETSA